MRHAFQNLNVDSKKYSKKYKAEVSFKDLIKDYTHSMDSFIKVVENWAEDSYEIREGGLIITELLLKLIQGNESLLRTMDFLQDLSTTSPLSSGWFRDVDYLIKHARKQGIKGKELDKIEKLNKSLTVISDRMREERRVVDDTFT